MDKVLTKIIEDTAREFNLDIQEVERVLVMPYKMMREKIQRMRFAGHRA